MNDQSSGKPGKSRRSSYRFRCNSHPVTFKTAADDGKACLKDISAGGCALVAADPQVLLHEKVLVCIDINGGEDRVEAAGFVVRKDRDDFAVEFTCIEQEDVKLLRVHFARAMRQ